MKSDELKVQSQQIMKRLTAVRVPLFLLLVAGVYAFIVWRISILQNAQPNSSSVSTQIQQTAHIDQTTINKIQQLQNSSISVQALFNQARKNPFQE